MADEKLTLHEAMRQVLLQQRTDGGWMERDVIAAEIDRRDLYHRRDGVSPPSDQLRLRALRYPDLFECVDSRCTRIRLRERLESISFDQVLAIMLAWQGRFVTVGVCMTMNLVGVADLKGTLAAGRNITEPWDHETFEFKLLGSSEAGFALHRPFFFRADWWPEDGRLIIEQNAAPNAEDGDAGVFLLMGGDGNIGV